MTREQKRFDLDDAVRRYLSGEGLNKIANELRIAFVTLRRAFVANGVPLRNLSDAHLLRWAATPKSVRAAIGVKVGATRRARLGLDDAQIVGAYVSGEAIRSIAARVGHAPTAIMARLRAANIRLRSASEQESLKWEAIRKTEDGIARQLGAAWAASRGRVHPMEEKIVAARTHFQRRTRRGHHEDALTIALGERGIGVTQQLNEGPYNIDLAIREHRVAVEIERPQLDSKVRAHKLKRTEYLLDRGWCVLFVLRGRHGRLNCPETADYLVSLLQLPGWLKSARGQYGVIGRDTKLVATPRFDLEHLPRVSSPEGTKGAALDD